MPKPHPTCGTCDRTLADGPNLYCHGAPPSCWQGPKVEVIDGAPTQVTATFSSYPPVRADLKACWLHPKLRKRWWQFWR